MRLYLSNCIASLKYYSTAFSIIACCYCLLYLLLNELLHTFLSASIREIFLAFECFILGHWGINSHRVRQICFFSSPEFAPIRNCLEKQNIKLLTEETKRFNIQHISIDSTYLHIALTSEPCFLSCIFLPTKKHSLIQKFCNSANKNN